MCVYSIEVCYQIERLRDIPSKTIAILPRWLLDNLIPQNKIEKYKATLDTIKDNSPDALKEWFNFSCDEIEMEEISKELIKLNSNIKIFWENPVSSDLLNSLRTTNLIPVIII